MSILNLRGAGEADLAAHASKKMAAANFLARAAGYEVHDEGAAAYRV